MPFVRRSGVAAHRGVLTVSGLFVVGLGAFILAGLLMWDGFWDYIYWRTRDCPPYIN